MKNKYLIILSLVLWLNIGLFYFLYLNEIETILIEFFRELTLIPSYLGGILCPILLFVRIIIKHFKS